MRVLVALERWLHRWGHVVIGLVALTVPALVLAAWFDPDRAARHRREAAALVAVEQRAEAVRAARPVRQTPDGVAELSFNYLEFPLLPAPASVASDPVAFAPLAPPRITALDARRVRITGFILPTRNRNGQVREFLLLANHLTCCYGREPRFCDYILARTEGEVGPLVMDRPVSVEGTLHVGDVYTNGSWAALYSMDCSRIQR